MANRRVAHAGSCEVRFIMHLARLQGSMWLHVVGASWIRLAAMAARRRRYLLELLEYYIYGGAIAN
jgi:hypothetical protein